MKKFDQWFFPDREEHLQEWMKTTGQIIDGRLTYQYRKYFESLKSVKRMGVAIDVGSHVGLWAYWMARDFEHVACFEPVQEHRDCWHENMKGWTNAELFEYALGAEEKMVSMRSTPESTGGTDVAEGVAGIIEMHTLDSFNFPDVDYLKIDCEGYELNVLKGAEKTLIRCKPCVVVEQKGNMIEKFGGEKLGAVQYLESLGAKVRGVISGDYFLSWDNVETAGAL